MTIYKACTRLEQFPIEINYDVYTEIYCSCDGVARIRENCGEWSSLSVHQWNAIIEYANSRFHGFRGDKVINFTIETGPDCAVTIRKNCYVGVEKAQKSPSGSMLSISRDVIITTALGLSVLGIAALCSL